MRRNIDICNFSLYLSLLHRERTMIEQQRPPCAVGVPLHHLVRMWQHLMTHLNLNHRVDHIDIRLCVK